MSREMLETTAKLVKVTPTVRRVYVNGPETAAAATGGHRQVTTDRRQLLVNREVTLVEVARERLGTCIGNIRVNVTITENMQNLYKSKRVKTLLTSHLFFN